MPSIFGLANTPSLGWQYGVYTLQCWSAVNVPSIAELVSEMLRFYFTDVLTNDRTAYVVWGMC